ncbi:hypothetical protein CBR56_19260 [Bacillus thuringiensis]|nr:hypothetical protein CBR56_19260 [Bacillus thuringiensis]
MKEATIVKEYEMKCKEHILTPPKFPFEIHEFQGYIYNDYLNLQYYNEDINGIFKITVSPVQNKLAFYVHKGAKFYSLKNNIKALYNPHFDSAYELLFQKNGFQYTIAIGNKRYIQEKYNVKDLIQIAESMNLKTIFSIWERSFFIILYSKLSSMIAIILRCFKTFNII